MHDKIETDNYYAYNFSVKLQYDNEMKCANYGLYGCWVKSVKNYSGAVLAYGCDGCNRTHGFCQCTAFAPTVLKESRYFQS